MTARHVTDSDSLRKRMIAKPSLVQMIKLLFAMVALSSLAVAQESNARIWKLSNQQQIEGTFQSFDNGEVLLVDKEGNARSVSFADLSADDQKVVMRATGWGRVWEDDTGKHHTVADLIGVNGDSAILEKADGRNVTVPSARLSKADRLYIESRRDISAEQLPETFTAKVVGIHDGDTVTVLINRRQFKIRLDAIDAPEIGQDFGSKSKSYLSDLIGGKIVTGKTLGQDKYHRNLCRLFVGTTAVNGEMIRSGLAWHYVQYSDDKELAALQAQAVSEKKNIWSESGPIPPWEWRRWSGAQRKNWFDSRNGGSTQQPSGENADSPGVSSNLIESNNEKPSTEQKDNSASLDYWLNSNSGVRHNRGCRWFENTKEGRRCGPNEGKACGQCGG